MFYYVVLDINISIVTYHPYMKYKVYKVAIVYIYIWAIPPKLAPVPENTVFALFAYTIEQFSV